MEANYSTILYWFCPTLTWIRHGCTCVPHPEALFHLPPYPICLGHPSAPAPSTLSHASNLDWWSFSHVIIYMFQCHSPKSSHPRPLPQNPKDRSIHLCLFCCLTCRVIVTIFLQYGGFLSEEGSVRQRPPHRGKSVSSSRAWREHGPAPHLDSKLWTSRTVRVHFGCSK